MAAAQGQAAARVAAGILLTRVLGFVRERVFAHYFGNSELADAFRAALRIPNVLRNLLGEGTLSASFIPVYAGLLERGDTEGARRLAGTIASLLVLAAAASAGAGILLAPLITDAVAPGFSGPTRDITVRLVEILFPMSGIMILSAWCLGVLNSHRRFFLAFAAPALWNIAQIATLMALGGVLAGVRLIVALAFGALAGSLLQLAVQVPATLQAAGGVRWRLDVRSPEVRRVLTAWGPVVVGAGVVQISGVIDTQLASLLGAGAVAVLGYAQLLTLLPISLFGVSIAAAALPDLSRDVAGHREQVLLRQLAVGLRRVMYFVVPTAYLYAAFGSPIIATLFETGRFSAADTAVTAGVLAAYAIGLPAQASIRLTASTFYALGDTRTPVRIAALAVALAAGIAAASMQVFGPAGIALGAAAGAYVNLTLLLHGLRRRLGTFPADVQGGAPRALLAGTLVATAALSGVDLVGGDLPGLVRTLAGLLVFGGTYLAVTHALGHPDAATALRRWRRRDGTA